MTAAFTVGAIGYLDRLERYRKEKPYACSIEPWSVPNASVSNLIINLHQFDIRDMRAANEEFSTDIQGFELAKFPTLLTKVDLTNQASIREKYFHEVERFLAEKFNAAVVHIFDATVRNVAWKGYDPDADLRSEQVMGVAVDAHVDQTPASVHRRMKIVLPDDYDTLRTRRIRVLNVWRPLVEPLRDHPLAMCDWRTTTPDDYVPCDLPSPEFLGETLQIHHNPAHQWWFASDMSLDETLLLKMYDSEAEKAGSTIAMCSPHCAFKWKTAPGAYLPRESMEVRAIVIS